MKKIIFAAFLLPILSFSYEINFEKSFSKIINPDLLTTNVNVRVEKKDENQVNNEIEKFNNYIKSKNLNNKVKISNGSYTLSPKYTYVDNKQKFLGYVGSLRYTAESKNAKDINKFMSELILIKEKNKTDDVKLNISNISWKISDEIENKNYDELRFESIIWIEDYAKRLSSKLSKNCEVKKVNINRQNNRNIMYARSEMVLSSMSKSASDVAPVSGEQNIVINPSFLLECK